MIMNKAGFMNIAILFSKGDAGICNSIPLFLKFCAIIKILEI